MIAIEPITKSHPCLKPLLKSRQKEILSHGMIVAETAKVIDKLIQSKPENLQWIVANPDFYTDQRKEILGSIPNVHCYQIDQTELEESIGFHLHHGVFAYARAPEFSKLTELGDRILILNGITSPENIGALIRTAAAFRINSIIFDSKSTSPLVKRSIRVSMGNIFFQKLYKSADLKKSCTTLSKMGYTILGSANESHSVDLFDAKKSNRFALIVGSEGAGMDPDLKENCDIMLRIPINSKVAHLNASNAASILMYELTKELSFQ